LVEVIDAANHRHPLQPLVFQRKDDPFGDGDGTMPANGTEAVLDIPLLEEVREHLRDEDLLLVADEVPGRSVPRERLLHRVH